MDVRKRTKAMTMIGLMTALLCIVGPLAIVVPISPVPISLTTLGIYILLYMLGVRCGVISCLLYLLMGTIGLPIFSGFSGGIGKLLGPTGGYLLGYLGLALISGIFIEKWHNNRYMQALGMLLGMLVCYLFGSCWLMLQSSVSFYAAWGIGVLPFVFGDVVKLIVALMLGPIIRRRLVRTGLALFPKNMDK